MKVYATVGDTISSRLNKKGEEEFFTAEGTKVISGIDIGLGWGFREVETSIRTLWPTAVIRFEKGSE